MKPQPGWTDTPQPTARQEEQHVVALLFTNSLLSLKLTNFNNMNCSLLGKDSDNTLLLPHKAGRGGQRFLKTERLVR